MNGQDRRDLEKLRDAMDLGFTRLEDKLETKVNKEETEKDKDEVWKAIDEHRKEHRYSLFTLIGWGATIILFIIEIITRVK